MSAAGVEASWLDRFTYSDPSSVYTQGRLRFTQYPQAGRLKSHFVFLSRHLSHAAGPRADLESDMTGAGLRGADPGAPVVSAAPWPRVGSVSCVGGIFLGRFVGRGSADEPLSVSWGELSGSTECRGGMFRWAGGLPGAQKNVPNELQRTRGEQRWGLYQDIGLSPTVETAGVISEVSPGWSWLDASSLARA